MTFLPKTALFAIATLLLAVATLVTDLVSPYAGTGVSKPTQVQEIQAPAPARTEPHAIAVISSHPAS